MIQLQRRLGIDPETVLRELERVGDEAPRAGRLEYLEPLFLAYDETILKQKKIVSRFLGRSQCCTHSYKTFNVVRRHWCGRMSVCWSKTKTSVRRYWRSTTVGHLRKASRLHTVIIQPSRSSAEGNWARKEWPCSLGEWGSPPRVS